MKGVSIFEKMISRAFDVQSETKVRLAVNNMCRKHCQVTIGGPLKVRGHFIESVAHKCQRRSG